MSLRLRKLSDFALEKKAIFTQPITSDRIPAENAIRAARHHILDFSRENSPFSREEI